MHIHVHIHMHECVHHTYMHAHTDMSTNYYWIWTWMFQGIMKIHRLPSSTESTTGGSTVSQALTPTGDETNGCPVNGIFQSLPLNETIHVLIRVYVVKVWLGRCFSRITNTTGLVFICTSVHAKKCGSKRNPFQCRAHYFVSNFNTLQMSIFIWSSAWNRWL